MGNTEDPPHTYTIPGTIEHRVYASSWPGYHGKHTLEDPDGGYPVGRLLDNWAAWFLFIERRTEDDPDDYPGRHALPPERGLYLVRRTMRTLNDMGGLF